MALPIKGIFKDYHETRHPEGFAFDVRNGVVWKGVYQNEKGTLSHSSEFNNRDLTPLCILPVNHGNKVIFSIRSDGQDEIGILDKQGVYVQKLVFNLGFNINFPIDAEAQYNYKDELIVAFTDALNTPKIINLDDIKFPFDLISIEMFPSGLEAQIHSEIYDGSGQLQSGSYQIFIKYKDFDDTVLPASHLDNPVFIVRDNQSESFESFTGVPANVPTDKAIFISLSDLDTRFKSVLIGVVSKIDGIITPMIVSEQFIAGSSLTYLYTGAEIFSDISVNEVIQEGIQYKTIKHFTQVEGTLYGASVTEFNSVVLQRYVNQIELKWKASLKNVTLMEESDKTHANNYEERGFCHGEVYSFYIKFKLKRGGWTEGFHIPGRASGPIEGIAGNETDLNSDLVGTYSYLDEDVSINPNSRYFQTRDTIKNVSYNNLEFEGSFGFWENENEMYPLDSDEFAPVGTSEDLRGKKVRHHRFPSAYLMLQLYTSGALPSEERNNYLKCFKDKLSFSISSFPSIPAELLNELEGYQIYYGERTSGNSTVLGEGLINPDMVVAPGSSGSSNRFTSGGNYKIIRREDTPNVVLFVTDPNKIRIHSRDLDVYKPSSPSYIENFCQIAINNNPISRNVNHVIGEIDQDENLTFKGTPGFNSESPLLYTQHGYIFRGAAELGSLDILDISVNPSIVPNLIFKLNRTSYVPENVISSDVNNRNAQETLAAELNAGRNITGPSIDYNLATFNPNASDKHTLAYNFELGVIKSYKVNVYTSFYNQKLVSTGKYKSIGDYTGSFWGGDVFIGIDSTVMHSNELEVTWGDDRNFLWLFRLKFIVTYISESKVNLGMRYEDQSIEGSKFYPKQTIEYQSPSMVGWKNDTYIFRYRDDTRLDLFLYNKDYSSINNINSAVPFNPNKEEFVEEDLYKIIRSIPHNKEEKNPSWRMWLANDYYIIPRNKGVITNIQGFGSNLFINTEASLFITQGNEILATNETEVAVGTGDIFARSLIELILDSQGYTGCQHKFSCLLIPTGYFFVDVEKKKVFVSDGKGVKDLNTGLNDFFETHLTDDGDNPFKGQGYTVAWDEKYGRVIFSKINGSTFTYSLTANLQSWTSWHDYVPQYLYNDRYDLYAIKGGDIHIHNKGDYGSYYGELAKPFHIVGVINESNNIQKLLGNMNWITEVHLGEELLRDVTFSEVLIWDKYQSTGIIELDTYSSIRSIYDNQEFSNIRRKKDNWNFNRIRDLVDNNRLPFIQGVNSIESNIDRDKDFEYKRRLIDKFFVYKLLFNNQKIANLNEVEVSPLIEVLDIDWKIKPVLR